MLQVEIASENLKVLHEIGKSSRYRYAFPMDAEIPLLPELERFWRTDDGLTAVQRAEAYGIDVSLLEENLRLTPEERIVRHDQALELVSALREAKTRARS